MKKLIALFLVACAGVVHSGGLRRERQLFQQLSELRRVFFHRFRNGRVQQC